MKKTVLLGMSGGVDSSVAALILKKKGYSVIGAFMKNFSESKNKLTGNCAWRDEREMAKKIASILGIPLITLDFEAEYKKQVIDVMFKDYSQGLTPNPDVLCNNLIKFPLMWGAACKLGADYIATGHYARIKKTSKGYELFAGKDKTKDQSYFLSKLKQEDLSHTLFPIGKLMKKEVRGIAKKNKFPNFDKLGTRGICFVGKVNLRNFLGQKIKEKKGEIIDIDGNVVGKHPGIFYFTIGQRIGERLGFELSKHLEGKWYVAEKRKNNVIVVAPQGHPALKKRIIKIKDMRFINPKEKIRKNLKARIRHLGELHCGELKKARAYSFILKEPVEQIAEGQFIVLYDGERVVGGGEIRI